MKKLFLILFLLALTSIADATTTPIANLTLQTAMNGAGQSATNFNSVQGTNAAFSNLTVGGVPISGLSVASATNGAYGGNIPTNSTPLFLVPPNFYWWASQGGEGLNLSGTGIGAIRLLSSASGTNWTLADRGVPIYIDPNYAATNSGAPYTRQVSPWQIGNRIIGIAQQTGNTNAPTFRVLCSNDGTNVFSLGMVYPFGTNAVGVIFQPFFFPDLTGTNFYITIPWKTNGAAGLQCYLSEALDTSFTNWSAPTLIFNTMSNGYDFCIITNLIANNYQMYYSTNSTSGNNICSATATSLTGTWTPFRSTITYYEAPRVFQIANNLWYLFADNAGTISALKSANQGSSWTATAFSDQTVTGGPFFPGGMFQLTSPLTNTTTLTMTNQNTMTMAAANFDIPNGSVFDTGETVNGFLFASRGMVGQIGMFNGSIYAPGSLTMGGSLVVGGSFSSDNGLIASTGAGSVSIQGNLTMNGSASIQGNVSGATFVTGPTYNPNIFYVGITSPSVESNVDGVYIYCLTNSAAGYAIWTNSIPSTNVIFNSSLFGLLLAPSNVAYTASSAPELYVDGPGIGPQNMDDNWGWPDNNVSFSAATNASSTLYGNSMSAVNVTGTNFIGGTYTGNGSGLTNIVNLNTNIIASTAYTMSQADLAGMQTSNKFIYLFYTNCLFTAIQAPAKNAQFELELMTNLPVTLTNGGAPFYFLVSSGYTLVLTNRVSIAAYGGKVMGWYSGFFNGSNCWAIDIHSRTTQDLNDLILGVITNNTIDATAAVAAGATNGLFMGPTTNVIPLNISNFESQAVSGTNIDITFAYNSLGMLVPTINLSGIIPSSNLPSSSLPVASTLIEGQMQNYAVVSGVQYLVIGGGNPQNHSYYGAEIGVGNYTNLSGLAIVYFENTAQGVNTNNFYYVQTNGITDGLILPLEIAGSATPYNGPYRTNYFFNATIPGGSNTVNLMLSNSAVGPEGSKYCAYRLY